MSITENKINEIVTDLKNKGYYKTFNNDLKYFDFRIGGFHDENKAILFVSDREGIDVPTNKHGKIDKKKLLNVIRDEFDLHDGEIVKNNRTGKYENHRDYTARSERFNGVNKKAYPNLIAKEEYINILNEIEKRDKRNDKTKK